MSYQLHTYYAVTYCPNRRWPSSYNRPYAFYCQANRIYMTYHQYILGEQSNSTKSGAPKKNFGHLFDLLTLTVIKIARPWGEDYCHSYRVVIDNFQLRFNILSILNTTCMCDFNHVKQCYSVLKTTDCA